MLLLKTILSLLVAPCLLISVSLAAEPPTRIPSAHYTLRADGQPVIVEALFTNHEGIPYQRIPVSYAQVLLADAKLDIEIRAPEPIRTFAIHAGPRTVPAEKDGHVLRLSLDDSLKAVVEINDGEPLFLFVDRPDDFLNTLPASSIVSLADFPADPTGRTLSTAAIQQAIDSAAALPAPSAVRVPAGTYLTGTVFVKSGVTLYLDPGAILLGSTRREDYALLPNPRKENFPRSLTPQTQSGLVIFQDAQNAGLRGRGALFGQGSQQRIHSQFQPGARRFWVNLLRIYDSENITVEGVLLADPGFWNTHILRSDHVTVRNVKVINEKVRKGWNPRRPDDFWNNPDGINPDGINPDSSTHVLIEDIFAWCGDDAFVVKMTNSSAGEQRSARDITIRHALVAASSCAMKLGTETLGESMSDITFEHIHLLPHFTGHRVIGIDLADNITISNVRFQHIVSPAQKAFIQGKIYQRDTAQKASGHIRGLAFHDIRSPANDYNMLHGLDAEHVIDDVLFSQVVLSGKHMRNLDDIGFRRFEHVQNVRFE